VIEYHQILKGLKQIMDKIEFTIGEITEIKNSNIREYDVQVILNGTVLTHQIFNAGDVVPTSRFDFAQFDLFTCGCGVAGCAGFFTRVIHQKTNNSVKWTFPDDNSYIVEKLEYEFDRSEFENALENLRNKMLDLEKDNCYPCSFIDYDSSYGEANPNYKPKSSVLEAFEWCENYYKAEQNFDKLLKEKFSDFYNKSFVFQYNDKRSEEKLDFKYLVCRVMNEWPSPKKTKAYLKKAEATGNAVVEFISNKNSKPFVKMAYSSYSQFSQSDANDYESVMIDTFGNDLESIIDAENFSLKDLQLVTV
jgi:hypothetical protein